MSVTCRDIMRLPSLQKMKLLVGEEGLNRIITWPYIGLADDMEDWVFGGELLFFTGISLKKDTERLKALITTCDKKNLAGIVFLISSYMPKVPDEIVEFAGALNFPVFELYSSENKLVEVTKDIGNYIVLQQNESRLLLDIAEETLFSSKINDSDLIAQARYFGYDMRIPHQVALMDIVNLETYYRNSEFRESNEITKFEHYFFKVVKGLIRQYNSKILVAERNNYIAMLIPSQKASDEEHTIRDLDEICERIKKYFSGLTVRVGVGLTYKSISDFRKSYIEAERALKLKDSGKKDRNVTQYRDLGIYKLFFEFPDLSVIEDFCMQNIQALVEQDHSGDSQMMKTLEVYFENKLNLNETAKALFIHRNTLLYRLNRIEKLLGRSLDDKDTWLNLFVSVLLWKAMNSIK